MVSSCRYCNRDTRSAPLCVNPTMVNFLQFISTGAIECVEGGGHYRPNKHAELARDIFRALERLLERRDTAQEARLLARKTHTKYALDSHDMPSLHRTTS